MQHQPLARAKKEKKPRRPSGGGAKELEKTVRRLEREIEAREQELAALDEAIAAAASDDQELMRLTQERAETEEKRDALLEDWESAAAELEEQTEP